MYECSIVLHFNEINIIMTYYNINVSSMKHYNFSKYTDYYNDNNYVILTNTFMIKILKITILTMIAIYDFFYGLVIKYGK